MKTKLKNLIIKNKYWIIALGLICLILISRNLNISEDLILKYLRDVFYASVFYFIFRNFLNNSESFFLAFVFCLFFEFLQLLGIPQEMLNSGNQNIINIARLIGITFSVNDIVMYLVGCGLGFIIDKLLLKNK